MPVQLEKITRRPVTAADETLLHELYYTTRSDELSSLTWAEEQKSAFLATQFAAKISHYRAQYPDAQFEIIELGMKRIGSISVERTDTEITLIDIALLPEFRNHGIGTELIQELIFEANSCKKTVSLQVEINNPAKHLYEKLGFEFTGTDEVYNAMVWRRPTAADIKS